MKTSLFVVATLLTATAAHAETPAALARQHMEAVASGDVGRITAVYTSDSTLQWVGGPLDGDYVGPQRLAEVWTKFAAAQAPLTLSVGSIQENGNPAGSTVTADVVFTGKAPLKVHYVMLFRGPRLVNETWQIDPKRAY